MDPRKFIQYVTLQLKNPLLKVTLINSEYSCEKFRPIQQFHLNI